MSGRGLSPDPASGLGHYQIIDLLGEGGMGVVHRAVDVRLGRQVALKVIRPHLAADVRFRNRFLAEARAAARVEHPHLVPIYEVGEVDGRLFMAMRLIDGRDLQAIVDDGPLEPQRALLVLGQIAGALDELHARGVVHRDVKPGNILVTKTPTGEHAYLGDFGLARTADATRLTSTGEILASLGFAAPEQFQGGEVGPAADEYALAGVLVAALTGEPPYHPTDALALIAAHAFSPPPTVSDRSDGLPASLDAVVARGMAKSPGDRYGSCGELIEALRSALAAPVPNPPPVPPPTPPAPPPGPPASKPRPNLPTPGPLAPVPPKPRRWRTLLAAIGLLAVTATVAAAIVYVRRGDGGACSQLSLAEVRTAVPQAIERGYAGQGQLSCFWDDHDAHLPSTTVLWLRASRPHTDTVGFGEPDATKPRSPGDPEIIESGQPGIGVGGGRTIVRTGPGTYNKPTEYEFEVLFAVPSPNKGQYSYVSLMLTSASLEAVHAAQPRVESLARLVAARWRT